MNGRLDHTFNIPCLTAKRMNPVRVVASVGIESIRMIHIAGLHKKVRSVLFVVARSPAQNYASGKQGCSRNTDGHFDEPSAISAPFSSKLSTRASGLEFCRVDGDFSFVGRKSLHKLQQHPVDDILNRRPIRRLLQRGVAGERREPDSLFQLVRNLDKLNDSTVRGIQVGLEQLVCKQMCLSKFLWTIPMGIGFDVFLGIRSCKVTPLPTADCSTLIF